MRESGTNGEKRERGGKVKILTDDSANIKREWEGKKSLRRPRFELGLPRPQRGVLTTILTPLPHKTIRNLIRTSLRQL